MTRLTCSFCERKSVDVETNGRTIAQVAESLGWTATVKSEVTLLRDPCCVERIL